MKLETSLVLALDNFVALRSKSYSFSYNNKNIQKAKQKKQKAPNSEDYITSINSTIQKQTSFESF